MAEKITWIDRKSVLYHNNRTFKAGDVIPAGILPASRIESFKKDGKIVVGEIKVDKSIKQTKLFNADIKAKVIQHEESELIKNYEDKPKRGRKSKAEEEEEELARLIAEEEAEG